MKRIEKLTDEQAAKLAVYRERWLEIGLSTDPLDFEKAKAAAILAYKQAGLDEPKYFYRFQSPFTAALGAAMLVKGDQVWDQVWAQVRAQVGAQVWDQVRDQVWDQVRDQVWAQVWDQVGDQVRDQVWDQVSGNHDAGWLGFYSFFDEVCGLDTSPLSGLLELAKHCGWWAPYKDIVILQDRPSKIQFDDQKRLHCEDGPAVEYRDGFSVHSWHGTRIPEDWLTKPLPAVDALKWENLEQRRAACEIIGWNSILDELNAITVDRNENPQIGELVSVDIPDIGREKFLRVRCGTDRDFALPVPPEMETAHQANAWTYGLDTNDYKPEVRT